MTAPGQSNDGKDRILCLADQAPFKHPWYCFAKSSLWNASVESCLFDAKRVHLPYSPAPRTEGFAVVHLLWAPCKGLVKWCTERQTEKCLKEMKSITHGSCSAGSSSEASGTTALKGLFFPSHWWPYNCESPHRAHNNKSIKHIASSFFTSGIPNTAQKAVLQNYLQHHKSCNSSCHIIKFKTN